MGGSCYGLRHQFASQGESVSSLQNEYLVLRSSSEVNIIILGVKCPYMLKEAQLSFLPGYQ